MMSVEMVTITKKEYDDLIANEEFLSALICGGVDNWEGYDIVVEEYENRKK